MEIIEGKMPFKEFETYYRIVNPDGKKTPLLCLHGGPGSTHNYFEVLDPLAEMDDRPIVMYDQIGCGHSMVEGHPELFTGEVWKQELMALREYLGLDHLHLLGQSWGGMLLQLYALDEKPTGIQSYIFSSTLSSAQLWRSEGLRRIARLPLIYQEAISQAESTGNYQNSEYLEALDVYMNLFCGGSANEEQAHCLRKPRLVGKEAYLVGWGPNEFTPTGTLAGFETTDRLKEITEPSLIISGSMDLSSPLISKTLFDHLPNARWELFQYSRHLCYLDETDKYIQVLVEWMNKED